MWNTSDGTSSYGPQPPQALLVNEQDTVQYPMFAHQILGSADLFFGLALLVVLLVAFLSRPHGLWPVALTGKAEGCGRQIIEDGKHERGEQHGGQLPARIEAAERGLAARKMPEFKSHSSGKKSPRGD